MRENQKVTKFRTKLRDYTIWKMFLGNIYSFGSTNYMVLDRKIENKNSMTLYKFNIF